MIGLALTLLLTSPPVRAELPLFKKTWDGCHVLKKEHYPLGKSLAKTLATAKVKVVMIADSKHNGMFKGWREACWVKTNHGIFDVVFFPGGEGTQVKIEPGAPKDGMAITYVTSPDGQKLEMQGLTTFNFNGPHVWINTGDKELANALGRIKDLP